jgi:pectin lyase
VNISYNELDGVTSWSSPCNDEHYWTLLLAGAEDYYTFSGNYIHDTSGRGPHIGTTTDQASIFFHANNNVWKDVGGHAFDIDDQTNLLIEGNIFDNVTTPMTSTSSTTGGGIFDVYSSSDASTCESYLGRSCLVNDFSSSGDWVDESNTTVLQAFSSILPGSNLPTPSSPVEADIIASAGVVKLDQTTATTANQTAKAVVATSGLNATATASLIGSAGSAGGTVFTTASSTGTGNAFPSN